MLKIPILASAGSEHGLPLILKPFLWTHLWSARIKREHCRSPRQFHRTWRNESSTFASKKWISLFGPTPVCVSLCVLCGMQPGSWW